jgi:hypothetical protein
MPPECFHIALDAPQIHYAPFNARQVLTNYLDFSNVLTGRRVCQGWRSSFGPAIKQLQLQQPGSVRAAVSLGRKAAAAFSTASTLCLTLLEVQDTAVDLTGDGEEQPVLFGPESL